MKAWLDIIIFSFSATNLYGYYKCRSEFGKKLDALKKKGLINIAGRFL